MSASTVFAFHQTQNEYDEYDESPAIRRWEAFLQDFLHATARALGRDHPGLADDLYQEALICLWELDPRRYDEQDAGFLRNALRQRMINVLHHEESGRFWDPPEREADRRRYPKPPRRKRQRT